MIKIQSKSHNTLSDKAATVIEIFKPAIFKRDYEFRIDGIPVGSMKFTGHFHPKAEGKLFDEEWKLWQTGVWKPFLEYKANQSPYDKGKFKLGWRCTVEWGSPAGKKYIFKKTKWWKSSWAWYDENNVPIVTFKDDHSFSKKQAQITIHNSSRKDLALPIFLAWFMILKEKSHAASVAASS
jgi:hypothetical protein